LAFRLCEIFEMIMQPTRPDLGTRIRPIFRPNRRHLSRIGGVQTNSRADGSTNRPN